MFKIYTIRTSASYETVASASMGILLEFAEEYNDSSVVGLITGSVETPLLKENDDFAAVIVVIATDERSFDLGFIDVVQALDACIDKNDPNERVDLQAFEKMCPEIEQKYN